jgi:hypothetical protein
MNTIELVGKTQDNKIECAVRSDAERDLHGVIDDPYAHIMGIATLMGCTLTIQDTSTNAPQAAQVPASASGGPQVHDTHPHGPAPITAPNSRSPGQLRGSG